MIFLQITQRAAAALSAPPLSPVPKNPPDSFFGDWMLNLIPLGAREAYLFMNCRSLLSFPILLGEREPTISETPVILTHGMTHLMRLMGTPMARGALVLDEFESVAICRASDHRMLGYLGALAEDYFHRIDRAGGVDAVLLDSIITQVNTAPRKPLSWRNSFAVAGELLNAGAA